jgi:predicted GNAT family acetyltransferase
MANLPGTSAPAERVTVGGLAPREHAAALARLRRHPRRNLFLIDLVGRIGGPSLPGEARTRALAARRGGQLVGVAALQPTVVLDAELEAPVLDAVLDHLAAQAAGLVRSSAAMVAPLWEERLARRGRRALVDRTETAFAVEPGALARVETPSGVALRAARASDLEALIFAARASLREEGRPDPFQGDPRGFRRWVEARRSRALVAEAGGEIVFAGYADVRLPEGWLLQGVYTWPAWRRRGLASAGIAALCRAGAAAGAEHVQLSVVDGNRAALRLYETLGFQPFAELRTLLFT